MQSDAVKYTEWFWGVVLVFLLLIGCVESNPGPRTSQIQGREQPRRHYGSTDNRYGRQRGQEDVPTGAFKCWPLMWWCKGEPLPDEEGLLNRATKTPTEESDDELLEVETIPADMVDQNKQSESELATDLLKIEIEHLKYQLEREFKLRQDEKKLHEENITYYKKTEEETREIHADLQAKLDQELEEKHLLKQQVEELMVTKEPAREQVDNFNKEFIRRKQLEDELDKEIQERKQLSVTLQQEISKRQQLEQDLRLQELDRENELRDRIEQNQEQEIQRRQLQLAIEQELQKRQDVLQQFEIEMKQKQELQRRLLKETQERHQLELELQEEIQVRHELELEFKQADLQSQILEQELRQQLRELQRLLNTKEDEDIEILQVEEKDETISKESFVSGTSDGSSVDTEEVLDETEENEEEGDDENEDTTNNDDEEKREIRQLLLEEFQRLKARHKRARQSTSTDQEVEDSESRNDEVLESSDQASVNSEQIGIQEENLNEQLLSNDIVNITDIPKEDDTKFLEPSNPSLNTDVPEDNAYIINEVNNYEAVGNSYHTYEGDDVDIVMRRANIYIPAFISEDGTTFGPETGGKRSGIILEKSLSLGLEEITEEQDTGDYGKLREDERSQSDYTDILGKTIVLQGRNIAISSFIGDTIHPETEVCLKILNSINNENIIVVGSASTGIRHHFIPRILLRKTFVSKDIFKHRTSKLPTVFAVSGMTKTELEQLILHDETVSQFDESSGIDNAGSRFILLNEETAESDYSDVCKKARNFKSIHWLSKQSDGIVWKKSKGHIDVVHQFLELERSEYIHSLTDQNDHVAILTGNNGDGQTAYLTELQNDLLQKYTAAWVIRVNIDEFQNRLEHITYADVVDILSIAAGITNTHYFELELLKYSLQITGNVIVLVDEISPSYGDKAHDLLTILKSMKIKKLVIVAHSSVHRSIENVFSSLAFTLKPLDNKELELLLAKLWKTSENEGDKEKCHQFSNAIINLYVKSLPSGSSTTPLDIKILAETFHEDFKSFISSKVIDLPDALNTLDVYDKYIEFKCESYNTAIVGDETTKKQFLRDIMRFSVLSLFSETSAKELFSEDEERIDQNGIALRNKFSFLHRNLQDFLTAKWFAKNYESHRPFIAVAYFEDEYRSMWRIFDRLLAKNFELHTAVLNRDTQKVKDLLALQCDINAKDFGGRTALHLASVQGKFYFENDLTIEEDCAKITSLLIDNEADVSITDSVLQWTALRYADKRGTWSTINELLMSNIDIDDMTCTKKKLSNRTFLQETGTNAAANGLTHMVAYILDLGMSINTPLHSVRYSHQQYGLMHIAAENGHTSLLEFLLENKADVDICNWNSSTPLHLACKQGKRESVVKLLQSHASVNKCNKYGDTPLHDAIRSDHCEIIQILLNSNADINICNTFGDSSLHIACQENNLTAASLLLDRKANKYIRNKDGDTPLDSAIRGGNTTLVKYILGRSGGCLAARERDGQTPLHLAATLGDELMLEYLLQVMPDANVSTVGGDTPLHLASLHGNTDATLFLVKRGADINRPNNYGNTPLHLASVRGNISVMNALLDNNTLVNSINKEGNAPLHLASLQGKSNATRCLLKHKADVDIKNREKNTPLQLAVIKGDLEVIRILIDANSDVNVCNRYGSSILHEVSAKGKVNMLDIMLNSGRCYLDMKNPQGDAPLLTATRSGFTDIVERLIKAGANINIPSSDGNAPIHIAVMSGNLELVNKLHELGADLNIRNFQGNTPLHRAVYANNGVMIQHLIDLGADRSVQNSMSDTPFDVAVMLECNDAVLDLL